MNTPETEEKLEFLDKLLEKNPNLKQQFVEWLRLARQIKGMEARTNELIQRLYNWKPALPALKDELRQAGIR